MAYATFGDGDLFSLQGRLTRKNKRSGLYFCRRLDTNIAVKAEWAELEPTVAQLANRAKFSQASSQASADMADPSKKAEWQDIADASNGKWKTARGAAFASYYAEAMAGE